MKPGRRDALTLAFLALTLLSGCGGSQGPTPSGQSKPTLTRWGNDLLGAGPEVTVADSIPGDVVVTGGDLRLSGVAGGDYLGAGRMQRIEGRVHGDVRAAGGEIHLPGSVTGNVSAAGGEITLLSQAQIGGNVYLAGGEIEVAANIGGFVRIAGGEVVLDGPVQGSVDVRAGSLRVGPNARIAGDLSYSVPAGNVAIDPAAQARSVTARPVQRGVQWGLILRLLSTLSFLLTGAVAVALFPGVALEASEALRRRPWASLGYGTLWALLLPVAAAAIAMTVIGVPLALILLVLGLIAFYLAGAVAAVWLGRLLLRERMPSGRGGVVVAFLLGGVILMLASLLPWIGGLVWLAATLVGLGSLVAAYRRRRVTPAEP